MKHTQIIYGRFQEGHGSEDRPDDVSLMLWSGDIVCSIPKPHTGRLALPLDSGGLLREEVCGLNVLHREGRPNCGSGSDIDSNPHAHGGSPDVGGRIVVGHVVYSLSMLHEVNNYSLDCPAHQALVLQRHFPFELPRDLPFSAL